MLAGQNLDVEYASSTASSLITAKESSSQVEQELNRLIDKVDQLNIILYGKLQPYTEELAEKQAEESSSPDYPAVYYTPLGQKLRKLDTLIQHATQKVNRAQL